MPSLVLAAMAFVTFQAAADVTARAQSIIGSLGSGAFAAVEAQFDDAVKAAMPPGRLAAMWTTLQAKAGAFRSCGTDVRVVTISSKQMVITPCQFEHAKIDVQFAFAADGRISGFAFRPGAVSYSVPAYANPSAYTEQAVTVGSGEWALPATLTRPAGGGPFPGVVLVHGSGPNDRDETIGANKPFRDLALGLATRGIAVLSYDKRSKVYGPKMAGLAGLTVRDEVVDDAVAALNTLRAQPGIDSSRVFVLGHSLGGMLVPRIAAGDAKLAGAIVMAGAARPLPQAIVEQTRYLANADGAVSAEEQASLDEAVTLAASVAALRPEDAHAGVRLLNAPASYWLDLQGYDPPSAARAIRPRLLILQGERDYQVTMEEFARWKEALKDRRDVTFHSYPALNHLFIPGTGKSLPAEYNQPSHVAEDVVRDIAAWIARTSG
jgi:dienelactone hydrolase